MCQLIQEIFIISLDILGFVFLLVLDVIHERRDCSESLP